MGLFSSSKGIDYEKELKNSNKYCEIIYSSTYQDDNGKIEYEIAQRIRNGRLIKDIKFSVDERSSRVLLLYDYEAEEKRRQQQELEKNNSGDAWSQKLENDKK